MAVCRRRPTPVLRMDQQQNRPIPISLLCAAGAAVGWESDALEIYQLPEYELCTLIKCCTTTWTTPALRSVLDWSSD